MNTIAKPKTYTTLVNDITELYNRAHHALVESYWQIGRLIVEQEQEGAGKEVYTKQLINGFLKICHINLAVDSQKETCIKCVGFTWLTRLCRRRHSLLGANMLSCCRSRLYNARTTISLYQRHI